MIPLLKNHDGNKFVTDMPNCRGITLSPVVSKVFETVLMKIFDDQLTSDPLQFGFKEKSSCIHALFSMKTVVDHYVKHGITVNVYTSLDISKAFSRSSKSLCFVTTAYGQIIAKKFIAVLLDWFNKCFVCIRWDGVFSFWFRILAGVSQG